MKPPSTPRLHSVDFLRGLVIAVMTLDHVREFFFFTARLPDPMDIGQTEASIFFTRWLAHFCAPVFVFLTGLSAYLHGRRHNMTQGELAGFLFRRGVLLILLEVTLINFAWTFHFPPERLFLQVIWAIGVSMVCLSALVWLPWQAALAAASFLIAGHNLFDGVSFAPGTAGYWLWAILHERSLLHIGDMMSIRTSYPVLPWIGVMALGYACGRAFETGVDAPVRRRFLIRGGMGMLLLFACLRLWNIYGDPHPWHSYEGQPLLTLMSLLNLTKYPPSLLFLLMTLGPAFLLLNAAERWHGRWYGFVATFGRAPFFYYVLHLYALHLAYRLCGLLAGYRWDGTPIIPGIPDRLDVGSIGWVWVITLLTLAILYPAVARLARLKAEKRSPLLSYL